MNKFEKSFPLSWRVLFLVEDNGYLSTNKDEFLFTCVAIYCILYKERNNIEWLSIERGFK